MSATYTMADVERIAKQLGGAARNGQGWKCRCPAHEDKNPSLSLSLGQGGKLLWHCHAKCEPDAVLAALRDKDVLLNGDARCAEPTKRKARIVATYPYVDE